MFYCFLPLLIRISINYNYSARVSAPIDTNISVKIFFTKQISQKIEAVSFQNKKSRPYFKPHYFSKRPVKPDLICRQSNINIHLISLD